MRPICRIRPPARPAWREQALFPVPGSAFGADFLLVHSFLPSHSSCRNPGSSLDEASRSQSARAAAKVLRPCARG